MASRVASRLAGYGWMTPLRVPFSLSLALALLRRPLLPRRRRDSDGTKCVRRSGGISKRRAMQPIGPSDPANRLVTGELEARWNKATNPESLKL